METSDPKLEPNAANELKIEIDRLRLDLAAAQQERTQSAAFGLGLLKEKEELESRYQLLESSFEQSKRDLQELREALNKAVNDQRASANTVFEKEVQHLNDNDALLASFNHAKLELERELKQTKSQFESALADKDRYANERDELIKQVSSLEQERKNLRLELKELNELKEREVRLFNENSELEEENVSLQKQVSNLRSTQVEFESSKHEIQRLQDEAAALNSKLEEMVTLKRISERQMKEALEALQIEREQKYALRKELDKKNSADSMMNWSSIAALKGSAHLANIALRNYNSPPNRLVQQQQQQQQQQQAPQPGSRDVTEDGFPNGFGEQEAGSFGYSDQNFDLIHDMEMPSIEGSLFDEVHLTEIKKLQQNLDEKENQRSNLNTKLIEIQHKFESKTRQAEEIEKKLNAICALVEEIYNDANLQKLVLTSRKSEPKTSASSSTTTTSKQQQVDDLHQPVKKDTTEQQEAGVNSETKSSVIDDFENIQSHLQTIFTDLRSYLEGGGSQQQVVSSTSDSAPANRKDNQLQSLDLSIGDLSISEPATADKKSAETTSAVADTLQSEDVQSLRAMLYKKQEQLKQLRTILKSNKDSAEVALKNLKSKYDIEKAIVAETMTKLRLEHKRLSEDAATFASLRSHFSARIEEYNTEIEKLQSKLAASEQEKNTLNSILRLAIEQKVVLTQKLEALEMDREEPQMTGNVSNKNANGQQARSGGLMRGRGSINRNTRPPRVARPTGNERR